MKGGTAEYNSKSSPFYDYRALGGRGVRSVGSGVHAPSPLKFVSYCIYPTDSLKISSTKRHGVIDIFLREKSYVYIRVSTKYTVSTL